MNEIIQNLLAFAAIVLSLVFLFKKFFWKKTESKKACGSGDGCGCH